MLFCKTTALTARPPEFSIILDGGNFYSRGLNSAPGSAAILLPSVTDLPGPGAYTWPSPPMPLLGFWQQPSNSFTVSKGIQGPFLSSPRPRRLRLPVLDAKAPASPCPGPPLMDLLGLPAGRLAAVSLHLQAQRPGFRSRQ